MDRKKVFQQLVVFAVLVFFRVETQLAYIIHICQIAQCFQVVTELAKKEPFSYLGKENV